MESAIKFANKYNHRYRIITLEGEVLIPGGSLSGGSNHANKINIINRKNRINELKVEVNDLESIRIKLEKEKNIYDHKKISLEKESEELEKLIKENQYNIVISDNNKEKHLNEISMLKQIIEKTEAEIMELEIEINNYDDKVKGLKNSLANFDKDMEIQKDKIQSITINYNDKKVEIEDMSKVLTDIKIKISETENNIKNLEERIEQNKQELKNTYIDIQGKQELASDIRRKLKEINSKKSECIDLLEKLIEREKKTKFNLDDFIKQKNIHMNDFYSQQNNLLAINKSISDKEKKLNSLDVKFARNSVQLENYYTRLLEDYELEFYQALKLEIEIDDVKEAINVVKSLKTSIKELGNINLGSIEEFKSLKSRLDFILNQQKDLINARETLKEIISDMEKKMEIEFLINFEKINNNFKEIFKVLFDGGEAELTLDNNNDILNSGININAQPPGKKLQNLSLLSGGEKSLTAVALLFSILNLKPAPFCVLDEIDASLDESNINKYTRYLKTLATDTQFVLITHRKTTMEIVDVLYGVAMEEEGVSKLISIKLEDYIKEIAS